MNRVVAVSAMVLVMLCGSVILNVQAASTFRCKNKIVKVGDSKVIVAERCGAPVSTQTASEYSVRKGNRKSEVLIEKWFYEFNAGFFDILTFHGDSLHNIEKVRK